jgi:Asp-tRNA(Asn)/Glu-tRNA(Gln) amidotransferase A subunit family amidase
MQKRPDAADFSSAIGLDGLRGARIGVLRQLFGREPEDQPATAIVEAAIARLQTAGASVIDPLSASFDLWQRMRDASGGDGADSRVALDHYFAARGSDFPIKSLAELVARGGYLGRLRERYARDLALPEPEANPAYQQNLAQRRALRNAVVELMDRDRLDVVIYPHETKPARTLAEEVIDGGERASPPDRRGVGRGNTISSATGLPTIVVPVGFNHDGVGVGLEFLGRPGDELTVIRIARSYEVIDPHHRLPGLTPLLGVERLEYVVNSTVPAARSK